MEIRLLKNNEEIALFLHKKTDSNSQKKEGYDLYEASNEDFPEDFLIVHVRKNKVKAVDIYGNLTIVHDDIDATIEIITQRAQEALDAFIDAEESGIDDTIEKSSASSIKPYDPDKIKVRQDKFAVEFVVNKLIEKGILDLNTDFQRTFVWDRKRQSRLIESIMLGIPIPLMYLSESNDEKFHVVDGLQRLSTFRDYLGGGFPLTNLEHLTQYDGCYFDQKAGPNKQKLDTKMINRIESFQLYFNIIEKTSPNEVKYDIFERLNTGGLPLNAQEIRNCNAEAHVRTFLKTCANSDEFKNATGSSVSKKRMDDQELVLRFAGFYLQKIKKMEYTGNMKRFLDSVNEYLNEADDNLLENIKHSFLNAMKVCFRLFGKYSFRKCIPENLLTGGRKPNINKAMFVVWSISTENIDIDSITAKYPEGAFASLLAEQMITESTSPDGKTLIMNYSNYYKAFTTGTFDVKTIANSFTLTQDFLETNNLI